MALRRAAPCILLIRLLFAPSLRQYCLHQRLWKKCGVISNTYSELEHVLIDFHMLLTALPLADHPLSDRSKLTHYKHFTFTPPLIIDLFP